jgi:DNA-binding beta-propeller fold protein YncE
MIRGLSLAVMVGVLGACAAPGAARPAAAPAAASSPAGSARLYVPNQNDATVMVLDARTGKLMTTVDLRAAGFTANAKPHAVIAEPDGSAWYVTLIGDGYVARFDRENRLQGRAKMETPGMLALDPRHDRVYASRSMTAVSAPSSIGVIRRSDMALLEELDVILPRPHAIAVDTVSGRVWVSGLGDNRIAVIDTAGRVELTDVAGPLHAYVTFALSPDGTRLAASTQLTSSMILFDVRGKLPAPVAAVEVLPFGYQIAWAPDGRSVWLGNQRSGAVTQVNAEGWVVAGVVRDTAFAEPHGVAVSADGGTIYVSSHGRQSAPSAPTPADTMHGGMHAGEGAPRDGGTVALIDARTRAVRSVVRVGHYAVAMGIAGAR